MIRKHYFLIDDEHWNRLKSTGKLVGRVEIPQTGDGHNCRLYIHLARVAFAENSSRWCRRNTAGLDEPPSDMPPIRVYPQSWAL